METSVITKSMTSLGHFEIICAPSVKLTITLQTSEISIFTHKVTVLVTPEVTMRTLNIVFMIRITWFIVVFSAATVLI